MGSATLRMAVIGAGEMGARHVAILQRMPRTRLVAVADPDAEALDRALGSAPGIRRERDWLRLLDAASQLDAAIVACPSELHAEVAEAAMRAGLHVLVEKPVATTVEDAARLAGIARVTGQKLMVGHVERFNPAVSKVRELVADGRIGRVYRAQATRVGPFPTRIRDVGVAVDLAIHDLDVMEHVLDQRVVRVYAEGGRFVHHAHEDLMTSLLRFSGGTLGMLDVNWLTPEKQRELVLLGEGGMLRASYITQDVWFVESSALPTAVGWNELALLRGDAEGSSMRFALRRVEPLYAELEAFVACVLDDTPEPIGAEQAMRAVAASLAMQRSLASGEAVELELEPATVPAVG